MQSRLSAQALVHTCGNILVTCEFIVHPRPALTPSTHAREVRYVGARPGTQTLQWLLPSSSSSTCFLLHHHVGQEWAPDPPAVAIITVVIDMFLATSS
jgi:hypothetical protein